MKLYFKNMVCPRCISAIEQCLREQGHRVVSVSLGEAEIEESELSDEQIAIIKRRVKALGFEWLEDRKSQLVEKVKATIIELVHHAEIETKPLLSDLIRQQVNRDYAHTSQVFSRHEGVTIEHYYILQKIERAKELLSYGDKSASEIAYELGYSSPAHFSNQFRKITGQTPGGFRAAYKHQRKPLDQI